MFEENGAEAGDEIDDDDVAKEREAVAKSDCLVRILDISKIYPGSNR